MKDVREEWYDANLRVAATFADVTSAAQSLAASHLSGPASAHFLAEALAAAALLGAETESPEETLSVQMKCTGPLGGLNVECTASGTLRGYTEKKILDDFDGLGAPDPRKALGKTSIQITRSVPGRILSQGISNSFDGYLAGSLQRKAVIFLEASVTDDVRIAEARGLLVEALPDSSWSVSDGTAPLAAKRRAGILAVSPRNILKKLGLANAELRKSTPLSFACRCSQERAQAMLKAFPESELAGMPRKVSVTCHMCGKTWYAENPLSKEKE